MPLRLEIPLLLALAFGWPASGFAQLAELASDVPSGANALVAMDVAALQKTALAKEQGWASKLEAAFVDRAIFLPPEAEQLLIVGHVRQDRDVEQTWETAVMKLTEPIAMRSIARAEGGYVDEINGTTSVWSPSDAYLVDLGDRTLGIYAPASRQAVGRWIDDVARNRPDTLSPYLQKAIARVTPATQVVMAVDLKNAITPHRIEDRLKNSETAKKSSLKLQDFVALLTSVEGATVEVSIDAQAKARSRIDFSQPVTVNDAIAKRLVLEALDRLGAPIDDLENHTYAVVGQSILVEGDLSATGLRRLFSVLEIPTTKFSELQDEAGNTKDETSSPSAGDVAENSQVYFKSVVSLLDDLRRDRKKQDTRGGSDGVWMERYARKIDRLPILYVDEELLDWGSKTAETLRIMAESRRNAGLTAGAQKSALRTSSSSAYGGSYYDYTYGYNGAGYGNGGSDATATTKDKYQIDRQAQNRATSVKAEGWRLIDDATANVRKSMTQKYSVEF